MEQFSLMLIKYQDIVTKPVQILDHLDVYDVHYQIYSLV